MGPRRFPHHHLSDQEDAFQAIMKFIRNKCLGTSGETPIVRCGYTCLMNTCRKHLMLYKIKDDKKRFRRLGSQCAQCREAQWAQVVNTVQNRGPHTGALHRSRDKTPDLSMVSPAPHHGACQPGWHCITSTSPTIQRSPSLCRSVCLLVFFSFLFFK